MMVTVQPPCSYRVTTCSYPCSPLPCLPISKLHACTRAARLLHGIGSRKRRTDLVMLDDTFRNKFVAHYRRSARPAVLATERQSPLTIGSIGICSPEGLTQPCWEQYGKSTCLPGNYQPPRIKTSDRSRCRRNLEYAYPVCIGPRKDRGARGWPPILAQAVIIDVVALARGPSSRFLAAGRVSNLGGR
jgi:hypothetical protein